MENRDTAPTSDTAKHDAADRPSSSGWFDLEQLRLPQDFLVEGGVKKQLVTVPVKRPDRQTFSRVHPKWSFTAAILEVRDTREAYLVMPELLPELSAEAVPTILFPAITRQGDVFLWPVRSPTLDGRRNDWNRSLLEAVATAKTRWTKIASNMRIQAYEIFVAASDTLAEPQWPDTSLEELVYIAFRERIIDDFNHPVIRTLKGQI